MFYGLFNSNTQKKFYIGAVLLIGLLFFGTGTNNTVVGAPKKLVTIELPEGLKGYKEESISYTSGIPKSNPMGGQHLHIGDCPGDYIPDACNEYANITSNYWHVRGKNPDGSDKYHEALDIIPMVPGNANHVTSKLAEGNVVLFATIDGVVDYDNYTDPHGAIVISIYNERENIRVAYAHVGISSYAKTGDYVVAGTPVCVMGDTGLGGIHLHYTISKYISDTCRVKYCPEEFIDPLPYLMITGE